MVLQLVALHLLSIGVEINKNYIICHTGNAENIQAWTIDADRNGIAYFERNIGKYKVEVVATENAINAMKISTSDGDDVEKIDDNNSTLALLTHKDKQTGEVFELNCAIQQNIQTARQMAINKHKADSSSNTTLASK